MDLNYCSKLSWGISIGVVVLKLGCDLKTTFWTSLSFTNIFTQSRLVSDKEGVVESKMFTVCFYFEGHVWEGNGELGKGFLLWVLLNKWR